MTQISPFYEKVRIVKKDQLNTKSLKHKQKQT